MYFIYIPTLLSTEVNECLLYPFYSGNHFLTVELSEPNALQIFNNASAFMLKQSRTKIACMQGVEEGRLTYCCAEALFIAFI